jgi:hypothetical protein
LHLRVEGRDWTIARGGGATLRGSLSSPPSVYGLLTELELRARPGLRVTVEPIPQDTRPSDRQTGLRIAAALLLAAAIAILVWPPRRLGGRPWRLGRPTAPDVFVLATVLVWWLVAPLQDDDGWVIARESNSLVSGGFSNYFKDWGADLPLATWVEWLQHFVVAHTRSLALARLPSVCALLLVWVVCRWCLKEALGSSPRRAPLAWWSGAIAFAVGAVAFGMTLRAEPLIALLSVGVLACCLRYARSPSVEAVALAAVAVSFAVTSYPSGLIAAAPLVLCIPRMIRDARRRIGLTPLRLASLAFVAAGTTLLIVFLDADLSTRRENARLLEESGSHAASLGQELDRYLHLSDSGASPARRTFVVLLLLAVIALLARLRRRTRLEDVLPTGSIALGLLFLTLTPSKWIWHFGGFIGFCAVAVGLETHYLRTAAPPPRARLAHSAILVLFLVGAASQAHSWEPLDVGRLHWSHLPALFVAAVLLALLGTLVAARRGATWRFELVFLPVALLAVLSLTVSLFVIDAAATSGWTTARQTVGSLVGEDACGLASDLEITPEVEGTAAQPWIALDSVLRRQDALALVTPVYFGTMPCATLPPLQYGILTAPTVLVGARYGIDLLDPSSPARGVADMLDLQAARVRSSVPRVPIPVYLVHTDPRDAIAPARVEPAP